MQTVGEMLNEFHRRPGTDRGCDPGGAPSLNWHIEPRLALIREEMRELEDAVTLDKLVDVADALADIVYTVHGMAWRCGIPLDAVVSEVHRSNMTKIPALGDGKSIKGEGYSPPDIAGVMAREEVKSHDES